MRRRTTPTRQRLLAALPPSPHIPPPFSTTSFPSSPLSLLLSCSSLQVKGAAKAQLPARLKDVASRVYGELEGELARDSTYTGAEVLGKVLQTLKNCTLQVTIPFLSSHPQRKISEERRKEGASVVVVGSEGDNGDQGRLVVVAECGV